jgi:DNA polymerase-3 subunit alpha
VAGQSNVASDNGNIIGAKVAQIITFGKMKARAVIRDVGRALNMPYTEVDRIAKLVPFAINMTLKDAFAQEPKFQEMRAASRQVNELLNIAEALEGFVRHASTHAAGVVISDDRSLVHHMPLFQGTEGEVTTQYDMKMVEELGLIKFDFLGLKTLTVLDRALHLIERNHGVKVDILNLDLTDQTVYKLLSRGDTTGIFQLESSGMRDIITRLKPSSFEDIIALVALYRPGPLGSGMVDDFIKRKHGLIPNEYILPQLEEILKETYGVILYQEQVMQIAVKLANYSMADADLLRKAMGKKIAAVMLQQKEKFMRGAFDNNLNTGRAEKIFDLMVAFGGYGFNKSHSAAYALISYQTAYLKARYPVEFMTALMCEDLNDTDKIISYISDCQSMKLEVLPPNVNFSQMDFEAIGGKIRFGLGAVKNIGEGAIAAIIEAREKDGPFTDIVDLAKRVDFGRVNRKVFEALIKCGALDDSKEPRSRMFAALDKVLEFGQTYQQRRSTGQVGLFDVAGEGTPNGFFPAIDEWDERVRLNFERESVGFYLTGHPLMRYQSLMHRLGSLDTAAIHSMSEAATMNSPSAAANSFSPYGKDKDRKSVTLVAMPSTIKEINTKKGDRMAFVVLEDLKGTIEGVVFADTYAVARDLLKSDEPLCIRGTVDKGEEKNKLLVNKVTPLSDAEALATQVHLRFQRPGIPEAQLAEVKTILKKYPGTCETFLHLLLADNRVVTLALPKENWVKPSEEFANELLQALGEPTALKLEVC